MIPYGRQSISEEDIEAVVAALRSDFLTQGPVVPCFEQAVADYCNAQFGIAVNSGTAALHIACLALGVGIGDWVWTSPISFVASANCALYCGAQVDFVDIEPDTGNMCAVELAKKLETAKKEVQKPFIQEEELKTKLARLDELNILLNMDKRDNEIVGGEPDEGEVPNTRKEKTYER